jgi:hypothetical protein
MLTGPLSFVLNSFSQVLAHRAQKLILVGGLASTMERTQENVSHEGDALTSYELPARPW